MCADDDDAPLAIGWTAYAALWTRVGVGMARIGGRGWPAEWLFSTEIRRILVFRRFARPKRWTGFAFCVLQNSIVMKITANSKVTYQEAKNSFLG